MNILFFDTETTGLPKASKPYDHPEQPHITQLGFIHEVNGADAMVIDTLIKPNGWKIDPVASQLTGITEDMCEAGGIPIADAMELFIIAAENSDLIVCHNTAFDTKLLGFEYVRLQPGKSHRTPLCGRPTLCTMLAATPVCMLSKGDNRTDYKWPKLIEAMKFFYDEGLEGAHSAIIDIIATRRVFHTLGKMGALDEQMSKVGLDPANMVWRDIPTLVDRRNALIDAIMLNAPTGADTDPILTEDEVDTIADAIVTKGLLA